MHQEKPEQARESGSTTKEMRFRGKEREKKREGGWAVVKLRATQPLPSSRDTISLGGRHSDTTLPTAAGGPPATKESETP